MPATSRGPRGQNLNFTGMDQPEININQACINEMSIIVSAQNTVTGVTFVPRSVGMRLKFRLRLMEQLITIYVTVTDYISTIFSD